MRPLKLSLQAFGSYPDLFEIDFVRLGQHGVFSITGPTGSGKTTIFDAMVYALYGKLPGKREADDVRSHFAKEGAETFVKFEFEVKGQSWTIERKPKQERKKTRGEGTTVATGSVLLRETDQTTGGLTAVKGVDKRVVELVGLDSSQFQQVVLLPQGEFEAVLKAETDQRVALLRQLFPVKIFNDFTAFLEAEVKTRREELDEAAAGSAFAQGRIRLAFSAALGAIPEGLDHPWYQSLFDEASFDFSLLAQRRNELGTIIDSVRPLSDASRKVLDDVTLERQRVSDFIKAFDQWVTNTQDAVRFPAAEEADVAREAELNQLQVLSGLATTLDKYEELVALERSLEKSIEKDRKQLERRWIDGYDDEVLDDTKKIAALVRKVQSDIEKRGEGVALQEELVNLREELETLEESLSGEKDELAELESEEAEAVDRVAELDVELKAARVIVTTEAKVKVAVSKAEQALKDAEARAKGEAAAAGIQKQLTIAKAALEKATAAF
jgi:DNA repair protein SbcC/Rad50